MPLNAGSRITAAYLNAFCSPAMVIKPSDQGVASSTVLINDNALVLAVVANATYDFACYLDYEGGTLGASDIKWTWAVPAGASLRYSWIATSVGGANQTAVTKKDTDIVASGSNGAGALQAAYLPGTLLTGATPGFLQFQWAQNTSNATVTTVHAQSYIRLWRIT